MTDTAPRLRCGGLWRGVPSVSGEFHKLWEFIGFSGKSETLVSEDEFIAADTKASCFHSL